MKYSKVSLPDTVVHDDPAPWIDLAINNTQ